MILNDKLRLLLPIEDEIPSEYQPVEYIIGHSLPFINTPIIIGNDSKIEIECCANDVLVDSNTNRNVIGQGDTTLGPRGILILNDPANRYIRIRFGTGWIDSSLTINPYKLCKVTLDLYAVTVEQDGVSFTDSFTREDDIIPSRIRIFRAYENASGLTNSNVGKMKVWDENGDLVADWRPCYRKSDFEIGFWDIITLTFYTNTNTCGLFDMKLLNPPVGYTQLNYIRSTSAQYIDTGIKFSDRHTVDMNVFPYGTSNTVQAYLGSYDATNNAYNTYIGKGNANTFRIYYGYGGSGKLKYYDFSNGTLYKTMKCITAEKIDNFTVNYNASALTGGTTYLQNISAYIFARHNKLSGGTEEPAIMASIDLWGLRIKDNNTIKRRYLPFKRNSDNVCGLYDLVEKEFYPSATGTNFTAGEVLL